MYVICYCVVCAMEWYLVLVFQLFLIICGRWVFENACLKKGFSNTFFEPLAMLTKYILVHN